MLFHNRQRKVNSFEIKIENHEIEFVNNIDFLGITVDKHLTWHSHIEKISVKISKSIGIMTRLKKCLPSQTLKIIYSSLVQPYLFYGILVWGSNINKIEILQKKAVRLIDKAFFLEHTEKIFKKYNLLKISDIYKYRCLNFFYRLINGKLPMNLFSILNFYDDNFRLMPCLYTPNSISARNCLRYFLPIFINSCPFDILCSVYTKTEANFNHFTKKHLLENYSSSECSNINCYSCRLKYTFVS